jgi:hypothetical protein
MKKKLFCLATVFFVAMCFVAMPEKALADISLAVSNPSFDEDGVTGSYSYNWSPWKTDAWSWLGNGYYENAPAGDSWYVITANAIWFQDLAATFTEGETINFSIDIGTYDQDWADDDMDWSIYLYDATVDPGVDWVDPTPGAAPTSILATLSGTLATQAEWYNETVSYTATASEEGHLIGIMLSGNYYTLFDHATVTTPTPPTYPPARNPSPADGAPPPVVLVNTDLSWGPPEEVTPTGYDLWFGDPNTHAWNLSPLGWVKVLGNKTQTTWNPPDGPIVGPNDLAYDTTYYWRVDTYDPNDIDVEYTTFPALNYGDLWSFTTVPDLPIILSQPQSVTVAASDTAVFTVGGVNLSTAQWYKDSVIMTGETSTTLTIGPPVLIGDEAAYYCVVGDGNPAKDVVSATARLLTKRLFAQWTFESTIDAVVGGFTGIYNDPNDPASAGAQFDNTDPSPQGGYAIKFGGDTTETEGDGYGESVSASEPNAAFNFYPLGLTASAWVKYDATSSGAWSTIVGKQHREDPLPWTGWGLIKAADDSPVFTTRQTSSDVYGTTNLLDDTWHLVTGTYDGETTRIYVDGELETEASSTSAMDINDKALIIGAERVDGLSPMNGLIDDVQIYTHALTGFEVLGLYGTPIITEHPVNQTISAGLTATLTVSVYSNPVVPETGGYEWFKDNSPVSGVKYSGEDSNTLTIDDFQAGEEGAYYCEVTNSNDTVTSETANLILPQLVSHWTFDTGDNLTDTVGSNDGSAFGADGPTYDPNAIVGDQALVLDGTEPNDVVVVPYDYGLNSTQFTVSLWAKVAGGAGTWRSPICSRSEDVTHTYGFNLYASMYDTWEFWSGDPGALAWYGIGSAPVVEDEWAYLVMTYDATTLEKKLYVNGELDAEETVPLPVNPSPNALQIGGNAFSGALFDGSIDDVKVYGYVRDAYDIAEEYVGIVPTAGVCPDPSTGLDYDLDGDCDVDIADFAEFAAKWYNCNRVAGTSSGEVDCK